MRILLTGASGFIGTRLARALVGDGAEVICVGRRACQISGVHNVLVASFAGTELEDSIPKDCRLDGVMHLAAVGVHPSDRDPNAIISINAELAPRIVSVAARRGARAVIVAGSSAEYRAPEAMCPLTEDAPLETERLYGASKAAGGILAMAAGADGKVPVGVLRLFNVYGPGEAPHRLLPSLARCLRGNEPVKLSAGTQIRDFVHVDDACTALIAALHALAGKAMPSGAYNVSTGRGCTVGEFARTVAVTLDASQDLLQFGALPFRPDDLPYVVGSPAKLSQSCGWAPRISLSDGIATSLRES